LQGSRRADALTLWTLLQVIGTRALGQQIDSAMALTEAFHGRLMDRTMTEPAHRPELNLQCFSLNGVTAEDKITARHRRMTSDAPGWFSLSRWRDRLYFRAVLLPPATTLMQLDELLIALGDS
jgi:glutamate/tyrosine decarboxylase-like PLP-dependent enzyme